MRRRHQKRIRPGRALLVGLSAAIPAPKVRSRRQSFFRRGLGTAQQKSVYDTLRHAHLAARPLRDGLDERSAAAAARSIRQLLDVAAVALADGGQVLAYAGSGARRHGAEDERLAEIAAATSATGKSRASRSGLECEDQNCSLGEVLAVPVKVGNEVLGVIVILTRRGRPVTLGLLRAGREAARLAATQLQLAAADRTGEELHQARTVALRHQISPHFVYNTLTAIASMVRGDPERAREALIQFAEFSRYILRSDQVNTTLADELRSVHTYLELERVRFGERLEVLFRIDPEVLAVTIPMLLLQPIVENAVQHGIDHSEGSGRVVVTAEDHDEEVYITISDNGPGMSQETIAMILGENTDEETNGRSSVGLANVQARIRASFGRHYRLQIESTPTTGSTVTLRVPKFRAVVPHSSTALSGPGSE